MLSLECDLEGIYRELRTNDPSGIIDQFISLPCANQYRQLYALTARYVPAGANVLDWGCGRGHFSYFLLRHGFTVTAYSLEDPPDIFRFLSESERSRLTFVSGSTEDPVTLPLSSEAFCAVFSVGVLEHVRETGGTELASLKELCRVLAPGGTLIAYHFPNRYSYIEAAARVMYGHRYRNIPESVKYHKHRFSAREIVSLTAAAGLELLSFRRYGFIPRNSFNHLPKRLRSSVGLASAANLVDSVLERIFSPIVQNFYFVACRRRCPYRS